MPQDIICPEQSGPSGLPPLLQSGSSGGYTDQGVVEPHFLAGADLAGLARFGLAVHAYQAVGDERLRTTAAVAGSGQFQQLAKGDAVAFEGKIDGGHGARLWHGPFGNREWPGFSVAGYAWCAKSHGLV